MVVTLGCTTLNRLDIELCSLNGCHILHYINYISPNTHTHTHTRTHTQIYRQKQNQDFPGGTEIYLPMQGEQVRSSVRELDPTYSRATAPALRSHEPQTTDACSPGACAPQ